ncbi:phage antirepressor KilAC domain-containing protein [Camelimonas lactis]|uniref:Phage antirepressor protein KilAC domain-containing protein n=1 Tax=Camelimonas lactis TaxID=659006 RepID=A0A4R2GX27_9HYPH|nr:phage antirepressor KilAC domain-containing protein [Camelimonas lactis]TCO14073.1 phage antirepressor protein KilAC domain-containing protein [Camelimonas lactis]
MNTRNSNAIITLHEIDGQPLVHDENLARELGYSEPRMIRKLILRNVAELQGYGVLCRRVTKSSDPLGRGRPRNEFYLNEEQALLLCMFSEAEKAVAIRREIIAVYQAWRKGHLKPDQPSIPTDYASALRLAADEHEKRVELEAKVAEDAPKVADWEAFRNDKGTYTTGAVAKEIGFISAQGLHKALHEEERDLPAKGPPTVRAVSRLILGKLLGLPDWPTALGYQWATKAILPLR